MYPVERRATDNGEHRIGDIGQVLCFIVFLALWLADTFIYRWSTFLSGYVPVLLRFAVMSACIYGAVSLGRQGHVVMGGINRHVVWEGAFGKLRHPIYFSMLLLYFGLTFMSFSLLCLLLSGLIFMFYNYIAAFEERYLLYKFGEDYAAYMRQVRRWIPVSRR